MGRGIFIGVATIAAFYAPNGARADERVVIVSMERSAPERAWPEAERRVTAELRVLGLDVVRVEPRDASAGLPDPDALRRLALAHGALAAIRIVRHQEGGAVDVWLDDTVTKKTLFRRIEEPDLAGREGTAVVAFRVVDLLHASLLEIRVPGAKTRRAPEVVEEMVDDALASEPHAGRLRLWAGAIVVATGGELGSMGGLTLGTGLRIPEVSLVLELDVAATPLSTKVSDERGEADVGVGIGRIVALIEPWPEWALSPALGAGAGLLVAWTTARAQPGFEAGADLTAVFVPTARFELALDLPGPSRILAGLTAGLAMPELRVRFAGETVATAGRLFIEGLLAFQWVWRGEND